MNDELYTVDEVAEILRTTSNTIYRWLRSGKLPGVKIGKEWRIKKIALNSTLTETNILVTKKNKNIWDKIDSHHNHVLAVTSNETSLYNLEAEFFKKGLTKGYRLFKGCWWQHPDDVRQELSLRGLSVEELEKNNLLKIINLADQFNRSGIIGPVQSWSEEATITLELGYNKMWGSGSPHLTSCGAHFPNLINFESYLNQAISRYPIVGICPYIFDNLKEPCFSQIIDLINHHKNVIFANNNVKALLYLESEK